MKIENKLKKIENVLNNNIEITGDFDGDDKLSYQHKVFVIQYCKHYNAGQAAIEAGYSELSSKVRASLLLDKPNVQHAILKRQQALQAASAVTREYVLSELATIFEEVRSQDNPSVMLQLKVLDSIAKVAGFHNNATVNIQNNTPSAITIKIVNNDE